MVSAVAVLLSVAIGACANARRHTVSTNSAASEGDQVLTVSRELGPIDGDDYGALNFGHAATGAELRSITRLVRRYYAAAAADNGTTACSMLYPVVVREVGERFGRFESRMTCPELMTKLFKLRHTQIGADVKSFKEVRVRVEPPNARVVLRFSTDAVARELDLRLVGASWKVRQPLDVPMR
jgi:hypothetical protein